MVPGGDAIAGRISQRLESAIGRQPSIAFSSEVAGGSLEETRQNKNLV
jgi:hypothetical protein